MNVHRRLMVAPPRTPPLVKRKRAGRVVAAGMNFRDDLGVFDPLGTTFFPFHWGWEHDHERTIGNVQFTAPFVDHYRTFGEMIGESWEDRPINPANANYEDIVKAGTDFLFGTWEVRQQFTIFGGGNVDRRMTIEKVKRILRGRLDAFLCVEISNENKLPPDEERRYVEELLAEFPGLLVGTTRPYPATIEHGWTDADFAIPPASMGFMHSERDRGDEDWRQVRQGGECFEIAGRKGNTEPPGFESSGEVLHDALRLASLRRVGKCMGMADFVLHTGAGIRFGGKADQERGRAANFWEYDGTSPNRPDIIATLKALRACDPYTPADVTNWKLVKGHWAEHPLPADAVWSDDPANIDHGCVRTYGGVTGNQFAVVMFGVRRYVLCTPRGDWHLRAYDIQTGALEMEIDAKDGQAIRFAGDPNVWGSAPNQAGSSKAYLIVGTR